MNKPPHLLVDLTAHGYGHVSQTAPVVNELARRVRGLRVTVRSAAPIQFLRQRFDCEFRHIPVALDFGMQMANAVDVEVGKSAEAYREYHANWEDKARGAADEMFALQPDLLLANVPYLSLAAAKVVGIRAAAMCSLNWADIYQHYCVKDEASAVIHTQMLAAYNSAEVFLRVDPGMPMTDLHNLRAIGPIAQLGRNRRAEIDTRFNLLPPPGRGKVGVGVESHLHEAISQKLILVAMGGIDFRLPMEHWPFIEGVHWLIPQAWNINRDDMIAFEPLGLPFSDLLASCDAVLTKPGYGTFVEAACAGVPVLFVPRGDWPEEPCLVDWLKRNVACREVGRARLRKGNLESLLNELWQLPRPAIPEAGGGLQAAEVLARMF